MGGENDQEGRYGSTPGAGVLMSPKQDETQSCRDVPMFCDLSSPAVTANTQTPTWLSPRYERDHLRKTSVSFVRAIRRTNQVPSALAGLVPRWLLRVQFALLRGDVVPSDPISSLAHHRHARY